jgi:hypothetical protein
VEEWNENKASQFGKLEIVDEIENADIIAAQFRYGAQNYVKETRITASTGKISKNKNDDFIGQRIGNSKIKVENGYEVIKFPLYSYLLVRNADYSWILSFSYFDMAYNNDKTLPEVRLRGVIEGRMKKR